MFFKKRAIRNIFFVSLAICILFPLINIYYIYPSFTRLLVANTEDEAIRLGRSLSERFFDETGAIPVEKINTYMYIEGYQMVKDFNLLKLKIFSPSGEIIYSTDQKDTGKTNKKGYFHNAVANGKPFTKIVKKDTRSLEGQMVAADVIETYVPVMANGKFVGAFEIFYDITKRNKSLRKVMLYSSAIPFLIMLIYLYVTTAMLIRQDKSIIKQQQTEAELIDLNNELEDEIVERYRAEKELIAFAEKLEKSNQSLQDFAHIASHDLQEPLRKVLFFGDRLKIKYAEALGAQGCDYLERMQKAANRMQNLINGLLMLSRIETKAQPFEAVDLTKVTKDVLSDLEVRIQETGGEVVMDDLGTIDADPLQVRQLFQNLIGNALKFHKDGETPFINISGTVVEETVDKLRGNSFNHFYQITFEDNGIGFDEKYTERIFGTFRRLHGKNEYEGAGIGLSVCRKIVERHGGIIEAISSPDKGAKFIITLPVRQYMKEKCEEPEPEIVG